MIGWIFLGLSVGVVAYLAATSTALAAFMGTLGFSYEPLSGTSLFTDWITWSLTDIYGIILLGSMCFVGLILIVNIAAGDVAR